MKNSFLKITLIFVSIILLVPKNFAQQKPAEKSPLTWYTNLMEAHEISKKKKKPVFAFFTGSDWCGWCKKLQADVFAKKEFVDWAKKNVILLEVDFPRMKALDPALQQQNNNLQQSFGVMGYPTIWMFNMIKNDSAKTFGIDPVGSLGYPVGALQGAEQIKFLHTADSLLNNYKANKKKGKS
ncbi:MAG: thioredoxin family protein [Sphingobacteriaceae bacterium]|nr:thioredoxin family protein [Sphingobacteriaceae bacterium]